MKNRRKYAAVLLIFQRFIRYVLYQWEVGRETTATLAQACGGLTLYQGEIGIENTGSA